MTPSAPLRVGWCPGALRPMASGDGLVVRVRPRGAALTLEQAEGLASAALRFGNGALDLTRRANVQVRGVDAADHAALLAALSSLDLLDADAGAEGARNVVSSPLAGLDPEAGDISPVVAALEAALVREPAFRDLPAKFGFVVDDARRALRGVGGDVRFEAVAAVVSEGESSSMPGSPGAPPPPRLTRSPSAASRGRRPPPSAPHPPPRSGGGGPCEAWWRGRPEAGMAAEKHDHAKIPAARVSMARDFQVTLGGDPATFAPCAAEDVPRVAASLALAFLLARDADPDLRRMAHAVARGGAAALFARAGLACRTRVAAPDLSDPAPRVGTLRLGTAWAVAGAAPFGRLEARQFLALGAAARASGASALRVTPWRALLVPASAGAAAALGAAMDQLGLVVDPGDPRLRVSACVGAPGCRRGTTPVLDHAALVAARLPRAGRGIAVHVSGCLKGCAHVGQAPVTLVGRDGRYDVVLDGRASDAPSARALDLHGALRRIETFVPGFCA